MKKILILVCLLTLSFSAFAQEAKSDGKSLEGNNGIDFIILELKLGAILGGYKNGKFINAEEASKGAEIGDDYTLFGLNVGLKGSGFKLTKIEEGEEDICPEYVPVTTTSKLDFGVALSSNARWNATPRLPTEISSDNKVYIGIVSLFIKSNGIKNPKVKIQKILKVDLEGDGVDEILIQARNRSKDNGFETVQGDYSFIMLRKIVNGKAKDILLAGDFKKATRDDEIPYEYEFSAILDLDGDGKMEIASYGSYYEGAWSDVFQTDGKSIKELNTGCGV